MTPYRVQVRIELINEATGRVVTHDTHEHNFEGSQGSAHEPFQAIEDAVISAIAALQAPGPAGSGQSESAERP